MRTEEQKAWFDYGVAKYFYFALKVMRDPDYRKLAKKAWEARKKAHRWLSTQNAELSTQNTELAAQNAELRKEHP